MSVPGAPTIGVITPSSTQLSVAFTAGTGTVTNYKYSLNGGGFIAFSPVDTVTPVVITGLTNGTAYSVVLRASNANGDSASSNAVSSTPRTTPGAPTIGTITYPSSGTISIPFTAPASDGGSAITNYAYSTNNGGAFTTVAATSPITISGLTNGTAYQVIIRAINAAGNGANTTMVSLTPYTTPAAPTIGAITYPSSGTVSAAFTAGATNGNAITNYEYSTDGSTWTLRAGTTSPISISGLTNGTTYTLRIRAVNAAGSGATQTPGTAVTPRTVPDAPTGVTVTPGATTVLSIAWTAPANNGGNAITAYKVERSTDNTNWTVLTSAQASSPYSSTALTNGTLYYYRVSATNAAGFGAVSSSASGTPRTVPGAPTIGVATVSSPTAVSVAFTAPASNGGNAITSYVVTPYIGAAAQTTVSGASSPISVTGLTTGQVYTFKVHAVNAAGAGTQSAASSSVSLLYSSVSAPNDASFTYSSSVYFTDSKVTYTGTASSDVVITPTGTAWTISAAGKTDTLNFVRKVVFTDKIIYLAGSGVDTSTGSSTVGTYTMTKTIVGGHNVIAAYITDAATEYTANSKAAVIYLAGDTIYTCSPASPGTNFSSPVSLVGITLNSKKPLMTRWDNYTLRFLSLKSSNVTIENVIFDLYLSATTQTETNAGSVDLGFVNTNLTLLENILFKNVDMVRGYQKGINMNYMNNVTFDGCTFARVTGRASVGMVSCKNVTIKNCTIPRSGTTLTGYGSIYIGTSNGPRDIYATSATYNNTRSGWTDAQKLDAVKSANIDLSLNNTFTDDNSLPATIQLDPYKAENGTDSFQYSLSYTGATPDVKLPSDFSYSFTNSAAVGSSIVKTNITKNSTDITGTSATWGFDPTNVTVRRLDTNARIYPTGYELPFATFDPTTITDETSIPVSIGGTRTDVPIRDSNSISGISSLAPIFVKGVSATPKLAVFTSSDPGAAVKNSIDNSVNTVAVQRTVNGTTKTSVMDVKKRSVVSSVVATKTVGGQTQTATADISSLPSTHSVILSVDDIDATAGLKANVYFKVVDGSGNVVTNGLSLPIDFDVPGTEAIAALDLYVYNTTTSSYEKTGTLNKKTGTTTTFSYTFTTNSDYQLTQPLPSEPTAVTVTAAIQQLEINWTQPTSGDPITSYKVYRGGSLIATVSGSPPETVYTNTGLANGASYSYTVSAVNDAGEGPRSSSASGTTPAEPDAPSLLPLTATDNQIELDWTEPTNNGASISAYKIYRGITLLTTLSSTPLPLTYADTSVTVGTSYSYKVSAVNSVGEGSQSNSRSIKAVGPPSAPANFTATRGDTEVSLSWDAAEPNGGTIQHYLLYFRAGAVGSYTERNIGNVTTYTLTGLTNGTTYNVYIKAVDTTATGQESATRSVKPVKIWTPTDKNVEVSEPTAVVNVNGSKVELDVKDNTSLSTLANGDNFVMNLNETSVKAVAKFSTENNIGATVKAAVQDDISHVVVKRGNKTTVGSVAPKSKGNLTVNRTINSEQISAKLDLTTLNNNYNVLFSIEDKTDGNVNAYFKVIDSTTNQFVTGGFSLPIDFDVPSAASNRFLNIFRSTDNGVTYGDTPIGRASKKVGTEYTFTFTFTNNSDYKFTGSNDIPCFTAGSKILTPSGYVAVEDIRTGDIVFTADARPVPVNVLTTTVVTTKDTAPYLVPKHVFGLQQDLRLSPWHAFQIRKGVWMKPQTASELYDSVVQYDVGKTVKYYHLETPNYFKDNLVCNGVIAESYAGNQLVGMKARVYHYSSTLKGYTRLATPAPQRRLR